MSGNPSIGSESVKKTIKINRKIDLTDRIDHKKWPEGYELSVTGYEIEIVSEYSDYNDGFFCEAADAIRDSIHEALEAEYEKIDEWVAAHSISGEKIIFRGERHSNPTIASSYASQIAETSLNEWFKRASFASNGAVVEMPKGLVSKNVEP